MYTDFTSSRRATETPPHSVSLLWSDRKKKMKKKKKKKNKKKKKKKRKRKKKK
jgi:hypothetical protein